MKIFDWRNEKNAWLKEHRGVCFEQVVLLFEQGKVLDILKHPNKTMYPGQRIAVVRIGDYVYLVPYEQDDDRIILKTIISSRKATNKYRGIQK